MKNNKNFYSNAPLVETVFEIKFSGEPAIECHRDKFYEKIKDKYFKILVPTITEGKAIALEPYKFVCEDDFFGIMLSINKLAVFCKKYEGFNLFKEETLRIFSIFRELFKIKKIIRTGLRYINIIPFTRENNIIPLENYLNIRINLPKSIPTDFKNLKIIFISQTKGGSITTRIEPAISRDQTKEAIILDFDYAKEGTLNFDSIKNYLNESHLHTKHLFEELITDRYRQVMLGEMI